MNDAPIVPSAPAASQAWAVGGLHCAACAEQLRAQLLAVPGVTQARVGYAAGLALVQAPAAVQALLPQTLRRNGYALVPCEGGGDAVLRRQEARQLLWRVFVAAFCSMQVMMLAAPTYFAEGLAVPADLRALLGWGQWVLSLPVMAFSATPFLVGAWRSLRQRRLGMDVPVALALLVTFAASTAALVDAAGALYFDSLTMFVAFLLLARWAEQRARHAAAEDLARLAEQPAAPVLVEDDSGSVHLRDAASLRAGEVLRVALGEAVPVDGLLLSARAQLDESQLSGEALPVTRRAGEAVVGGSLNLGAPLRLLATAGAGEGQAARLAAQWRQALTERPPLTALADRWAQVFLAVVLLLAVGVAVWTWPVSPSSALERACAVLIVTCPCAFALAQPAAWVASQRRLLQLGVMLQRAPALQALAQADSLWLDKTGTLTRPSVRARACSADAVPLAAAVALASWSQHPMAAAVARLPAEQAPPWRWQEVEELPGQGLRGRDAAGQLWHLTRDPERAGLRFGREGQAPQWQFDSDEAPAPEAARALNELRALGLRVGLLSGDHPARVQAVAQALGIDEAQGACSAQDKLARLRADQATGARVLMVGDGVNDAPVLAQADASIAVAQGTAMAAQAADVRLLRSDLALLPALIRQARRTQRVMRQNLAWAAAYNLAAVPLALLGALPPWAASLGMALSSLLVVGNALRLAR